MIHVEDFDSNVHKFTYAIVKCLTRKTKGKQKFNGNYSVQIYGLCSSTFAPYCTVSNLSKKECIRVANEKD
jgi:hypothetical protein